MQYKHTNLDMPAISHTSSLKDEGESITTSEPLYEEALRVVDIGINLLHPELIPNWKEVIRRAVDAGVDRIVLTGTSVHSSRICLALARQWYNDTGVPNLCATVGVHPYEANNWRENSLEELRKLLMDPFAVAVGECGLDYKRNYTSKSNQIQAFREQLALAHEMNFPIFLHERDAHSDFLSILDEIRLSNTNEIDQSLFPKIVVHCFTGTKEEASVYIERGFFLSFAGTICKKRKGAHLRELLPSLPLEQLMVETDAPFMVFKNKRTAGQKRNKSHSEPADCVDVARQLSKTIGLPLKEVCKVTTTNATAFFGLDNLGRSCPLIEQGSGDRNTVSVPA